MNLCNFDRSYEEIEPIPQRGRQKILQHIIVGVIAVCIGALVFYVVFKSFHNSLRLLADDDTTNLLRLDGSNNSSLEEVIINLSHGGSVLGKRMKSRAGKDFFAFLGIPYAKPPLGELRFQPPVPAEAWNGTLNATQFKPACIQKERYNPGLVTQGDEDCLYVNVYTPKTLSTLKLRFDYQRFPVLVYIHGGGQFGNSTKYGPEYLMDSDVIYVNFHYRLGVLGNLNAGISEARGNQGLKDQILVLQWIKDNIKAFGGHNQKVTLFGNSYGGQQASLHLISPMSKGLFQRAICQSGTELVPFIFTRNPLKSVENLGRELKCVGVSPEALVSCFRNTSAETLILTSYQMEFHASVEPDISGKSDVFLSDTPLNLLQNGQMNQVPVIFGGTSGEGLAFSLPILSSPSTVELFNTDWENMAIDPLMLNNSDTLLDPRRIANKAKEFYLDGRNLSRDVEINFTAMITDRKIMHPAAVFADFQFLKNNGTRNNVYLYYFNHPPDKSSNDGVIKNYGADEYLSNFAGHGDELHYLFPYAGYDWLELGTKHGNFSEMLIELWVAFADKGEPEGFDWLPLTRQKPHQWFEITSDPKMIDFMGKRMDFWDSFYLTDLYI